MPCTLLLLWIISVEIPLRCQSVASLSLHSSSKEGKTQFPSLKKPTHKDRNDTSRSCWHLPSEPLLFLDSTWDSWIFRRNSPQKSRVFNQPKLNRTYEYRNLKLNSHAKIPHVRSDDRYDDINEYDIRRMSQPQEPEELFAEEIHQETVPYQEPPEPPSDQEPEDEGYLRVPRKWKPSDDVAEAYMMGPDVKLSLEKWPKNCFLRVKLYSYYSHLATLGADRIKLALKDNPNLKVANTMSFPMRRKRWCYLSSAFIDKRSKDLIEIQEHVRLVDILPVNNESPGDFKGILMIPLPKLVSFDYWFEEVHRPVKSRHIHDLFRERRWVSKYFLYHRDKHKKRELIKKLTSPELVDEIPLRWKRAYEEDYYFLQLCELRKLYNFVVARKAEDEARRFYNVKMPEIWDFGEVRFIGNREDRQYDPDYSSVDKI